MPGPSCYARGGTEPTVTDSNLLFGDLDRGSLLAGDLPIDYGAAERAVGAKLAEPLKLEARAAAAAVIDVVNHAMAEALKIVSVQRGHDPREFILAAFGGAGPMHAAALAEELGMAEVVCPPIPGAFSALGLVGSDLKRDYVRTVYTTTATADRPTLRRRSSAWNRRGRPCSIAPGSRHRSGASCAASMPDTGGNPRVTVPVPGRRLDAAGLAAVRRLSTRATVALTVTTTGANRCSS